MVYWGDFIFNGKSIENPRKMNIIIMYSYMYLPFWALERRKIMKRTLSFILALVMLIGLMPMTAFATEEANTASIQNPFEGKKVSILSHSMSTYAGVSNSTAANSTLGSNDVYYTAGRHDVYREDTWWQQVIDALDMELLVNNSWSGSCVFMPRKGEASVGYGDRAVNLHNDHTGEEPDIIFVYLGCNDFAYYKDTFGEAADVNYAALITDNGDGTFTYATPTTTCEAYAIMLHKAEHRYPDAEIYCMTSTARRETDYTGDTYPDAGQPTAYSAELQKVAQYFGYPVVDLENAIPKDVETFDKYIGDKRAHANALGMDQIANEVLSVMLGKDAEICHVTSEDGTVREQAVLLGGSYYTDIELQEGYSVIVTMDGEDVTDEVCNNGKISIEKVTGDIAICTTIQRDPFNFRWEMQEDALISIGDTDNALSKLAGTVTNGVLNNTRYQLATSVVLKHDLPWEVEWQFSGNWRGCVFTSDPVQNTKGMVYLSRTNGGQLCFGTWTGSQYDNYGVDLSYLDDQVHTYRFVNRIAADGSNMVWVYVDGEEIGPMNHYYIGSKDQGKSSDWISGKDFVFSYISMEGHALKDCRLNYLQVQECNHTYENGSCTGCGENEPFESMSLRYDDHLDMSGKTVEIINAGTPTSYQVGYGVEENKILDTAVVTLKGNTLVATGIGTATVKIDGETYEITVTAAPISLLLLIGQSNMRGSEGNANQSIVCPDGMVYSTYGDDRGADNTAMTVSNAAQFAPSALTGTYSSINVVGTTDCLSGYPVCSLTEAGAGKIGPDSGFAYEWVKQTGEKVWVVNAAHGGTNITAWQPGTKEYEECQALFTACQETLRKEIAAGHFTLSHMAYFWCQGCTNRINTAEWYVQKYLTMHESLKSEMSFDHDSNPATTDKTFEFGGIIPVRVGSTTTCYRDGVYESTNPYAYHESYVDLRFSGPKVAQYWMCNNPELEDIWMVCNIGEDWVWMPDGTNGVAEYFRAHYENGTVDYTTQVAQKASWYTPTTPAAVHDSIHYNQIGYNEVGRESVRNALIMLGEIDTPEVETSVKFLGWDGYNIVDTITAATTGTSDTLVVPKVYPLWKAKEVAYALSDGLTWDYYDLLAADAQTTGILTADGLCVNVLKAEPGSHYADHLSELPENLCCGLNLWNELDHDKYFFTYGTHWTIHSSGDVYSVTFPVNPGDLIYATAFGKAGENGSISTNGIRMTFFSEYGVVKTLDPAGTYAEFTANGGYIIAPEGTVAVNIPMWTSSDSNEVYILNRPHDTTNVICSICEKNSHEHDWSDWEMIAVPEKDEPVIEKRTCSSCGETETREVESVWQKYNLAEHYSNIPENVCSGLNLWNVLEHDKYYFASGTNWSIYSSGKVYSVTIPVEAGDKIFATAWGKAGENGHASTSGIRVSFFDAYGVAKTMTPVECYAEFSENGGYLIAPEDAIAINVAMWNNSDKNEIYILNRAHTHTAIITKPTCTERGYTTYTCDCGDSYVDDYVDATGHSFNGATCTICGAEHQNVPNYKGKVISILSASTSTFAGYIPVADGFNLEHRPRYPQDNLLTDVNETWWMQVINDLDAKLGINDSWAGSQVLNMLDKNSGDLGPDAAMASITRIKNLGANGTPDIILFFGAGNDMGRGVPAGSFDPATAPSEVDLTTTKWETLADAYVAAIMRLKYFYPDAKIIAMSTYAMPSYVTQTKLDKYGPILEAICEYYGVEYLSLNDCGVTFDMLPDNIHPNAEGMDQITAAVVEKLLFDVEIEAGESTVHTVTHELTQATASLSYYKGISEGHSFEEMLFGENVTVSITMGGVDITDSCYADNKIHIARVTGDLVITVKGAFTADGHLQQLPEMLCPGINLWQVLEPENIYYTVSGWGNTTEGTSWSITFPVKAGDRIWAISLGAYPDNGSSANGVRVTWFDENGVLQTLSRDIVYAEFAKYGYITAPEGAVALNLPMTYNQEHYAVYILSAEHDYRANVTNPTCTEQGYTTYTCTTCGDSYVDSYVDALDHSFGSWIVTTKPSCTKVGEERRDCDACEHYETREVKALGHSYTPIVTDPACSEQGYTTYTCACGDSYVDDYVEATGHTYGNWYTTKSPTCTEKGEEEHKCSVCQHTETRTTASLGHTESAAVVENKINATCTAEGKYDSVVYCLVCGHELSRKTNKIEKLDHSYVSTITPPTCTEQGYTTHTCKCGNSYVDTYTEATGHTYGEWYTTKEPTESAQGEKRRDCSNCDAYETSVLAALDHDHYRWETIVLEAKKPTCTVSGLTEGSKCSKCGEILVSQNTVPATGHSFGDWFVTKTPTCTEAGEEKRECANCDHFETRVVDKIAHTYVPTVTKPTCTEQGYTTHTCECGDSYVDTYVEATGHSYGEWYVTKAPTCTATGTDEHRCSVCQHTEMRTTDALGHNYSNEWTVDKHPTCTTAGSKSHHCTRCDDKSNVTAISAIGHNFGEWYTTKSPTCTEKGEEKRECVSCDYFEKRAVDKLAHTYTSVVTNPTCTKQGYTTHTCKCGDSYVDTYTESAGHTYGDWQTTKVPTCISKGEEKRECNSCEHFEARMIDKASHTYKSVVTRPTCTDGGYTNHICTVCGNSYVDTYTEATGHTYGEWQTTKSSTCTAKGEEKRKCVSCDYFETREIDKIAHTYVDTVTEPTCTEQGYTTHKCECGDSYIDTYTEPAGHSYGDWFVTVAPTCTEKGEERRECANCNHFETRVVDKIAHTYVPTATPPTCTEGGYTTHTCECGDSYVDTYTEPTGHNFGEWFVIKSPTCTEVGSEERTCNNCDCFETNEIEATGHSFTHYIPDGNATLEADGTKTAVCDNGCGTKDTVTDEGSKLEFDDITSDIYEVKDGYISGISIKTTAKELKESVNETDYVRVVKDGKVVEDKAVLATGMKLQLVVGDKVIKEVTVVVVGDTNGDGNISVTDMIAVKAHILKKSTLKDAHAKAGDTNGDGNISITDFIQIKAHILGKSSLEKKSVKTVEAVKYNAQPKEKEPAETENVFSVCVASLPVPQRKLFFAGAQTIKRSF